MCAKAVQGQGHGGRGHAHQSGDIQAHLQAMFRLLRPADTLKMAVKLESAHEGRTRYLVVVCAGPASPGHEEASLLGVDCNDSTSCGLVLPILADTSITLDGDGSVLPYLIAPGPFVNVRRRCRSALQTLHKACRQAQEKNHFVGGPTHAWVSHYAESIGSDQSCINEWNAMADLESRRPPSPDSLRCKPGEREGTEKVIKARLKEIMMSVDLDEVTSKYIRGRLEETLNMDLEEFKSFIDQEMITILGQMDAATRIFDYLYLGSEWNASNLEELHSNGIKRIMNVTREIDNFFPGMFTYINIRVYDNEATDLLKHWDKTYKVFVDVCTSSIDRESGERVLVHCKMGVSRSASVVIAYVMKAYEWSLQQALDHVKRKRSCVHPNDEFMKQLEMYEGILDASKHRNSILFRSKSETSIKTEVESANLERERTEEQRSEASYRESWRQRRAKKRRNGGGWQIGEDKENKGMDVWDSSQSMHFLCTTTTTTTLSRTYTRPKSWSPDDAQSRAIQAQVSGGEKQEVGRQRPRSYTGGSMEFHLDSSKVNILLPCSNGQSYSVSQNKALNLHIPLTPVECINPVFLGDGPQQSQIMRSSSVKDRISELESQFSKTTSTSSREVQATRDVPDRTGLVLNLATQFESGSRQNSPVEELHGSLNALDIASSIQLDIPVQRRRPASLAVINIGERATESSTDEDGAVLHYTKEAIPWTPGTVRRQTQDFEEKVKQIQTLRKTSKEVVVTTYRADVVLTQNPPPPRKDSTDLVALLDRKEDQTIIPISRQSSFGSVDSAVVLRQNSWGSWDTRPFPPSRTGSFASYDIDADHRPNPKHKSDDSGIGRAYDGESLSSECDSVVSLVPQRRSDPPVPSSWPDTICDCDSNNSNVMHYASTPALYPYHSEPGLTIKTAASNPSISFWREPDDTGMRSWVVDGSVTSLPPSCSVMSLKKENEKPTQPSVGKVKRLKQELEGKTDSGDVPKKPGIIKSVIGLFERDDSRLRARGHSVSDPGPQGAAVPPVPQRKSSLDSKTQRFIYTHNQQQQQQVGRKQPGTARECRPAGKPPPSSRHLQASTLSALICHKPKRMQGRSHPLTQLQRQKKCSVPT
ncbi:unnamed protein product [Darwinula stevensoni]|uniref:protein-serine/threonine phosphatase n=1 Tax=Darwinula stevensoni TaxID=69355 RepID=A0A7R9AFV2_9CRUS|nr:unnamed protein product [Darwinula stevensoni]CAG0903656.1 unnamed protein product [Darwinula stevensoni]